MKPRLLFAGIAWTVCLCLQAAEPSSPRGDSSPLSLKNAYRLALQTHEDLQRQQQEIRQSQWRARAALGTALPRLSWEWQATRQDGGTSGPDSFGGLLDKNQVASWWELRQPLFTGLKEFSAWSGLKKQQERDQWRLRQMELALYQQVATAFYDLLALEKSGANLDTLIELSQERIDELKSFLRLGKSRESELFSAESQLATWKANRLRVSGQIQVVRESLSFLVGETVGDAPLDAPDVAHAVEPLATYLSRAQQRPDLEAQRQDVLEKACRVRYEKGSFWPVAQLAARSYLVRPVPYNSVDWDVTLLFSAPIFQGGIVRAHVQEAQAALESARQTLAALERETASEVKKAHLAWASSLEETHCLEEAYRAAKKSDEAQRKEYRLGLVTNLDVLNATNALQAARSAWDESDVESRRRYVALITRVGALP